MNKKIKRIIEDLNKKYQGKLAKTKEEVAIKNYKYLNVNEVVFFLEFEYFKKCKEIHIKLLTPQDIEVDWLCYHHEDSREGTMEIVESYLKDQYAFTRIFKK